uniref:Uncharacterized protein n=1 Tax=Trichobilharzia regenti TaxID=157069 RepID=A0AA85JPE0_TRIRE|nr:unnamed protein product [Trichobilharzia regenti]
MKRKIRREKLINASQSKGGALLNNGNNNDKISEKKEKTFIGRSYQKNQIKFLCEKYFICLIILFVVQEILLCLAFVLSYPVIKLEMNEEENCFSDEHA